MQRSPFDSFKVGLAELVSIAHGQHEPVGEGSAEELHKIEGQRAAAIVELMQRAEIAIETESFGKPGEFVCDQERRAF